MSNTTSSNKLSRLSFTDSTLFSFACGLHQLAVAAAVEGPSQCLPGSFNCALLDLESSFVQHFHELGCCGLVILLHPLLYGVRHFAGELKRSITHVSVIVGKKMLHVSCSSVWLSTPFVWIPKTLLLQGPWPHCCKITSTQSRVAFYAVRTIWTSITEQITPNMTRDTC